jgi:hypothetical protein
VGTGNVNGKELTLAKDVVAPGAPDATPGGGTYAGPQGVTLDKPDPASVIHYSANGTTPTAASPVAPAQLLVSSSQVIRAVAIDAVGNVSPVSTFAYTIMVPGTAGGSATTGSGSTATGSGTAAALAPGVAQVLSAQVRVLGTLAVGNLTVARRISVTRLRAQGLRMVMRLPSGTDTVRFALYRARNGKRTGSALATGSRTPSRAGTYRLTVRSPSLLRKLKPGAYVLQVKAGSARNGQGPAASVAFTVTR